MIEVQRPQDHPIAFESLQPKPGWEVETTTRTLDTPVEGEGETIAEAVDTCARSGWNESCLGSRAAYARRRLRTGVIGGRGCRSGM